MLIGILAAALLNADLRSVRIVHFKAARRLIRAGRIIDRWIAGFEAWWQRQPAKGVLEQVCGVHPVVRAADDRDAGSHGSVRKLVAFRRPS